MPMLKRTAVGADSAHVNLRTSVTAPTDSPATTIPPDSALGSPDDLVWGDGATGRFAPPPVDAAPAPLAPPAPNDVDDLDDLRRFAASVEEGRREAHRLRWLVGGLVSAMVFSALVLGGVRLADRRDAPGPSAVPDASSLVDPSALDAATLLADDLDGAFDDVIATSLRWNDPSGQRLGQRLDVAVELLAGTHTITTDDGLELRFDGLAYEGRTITDGAPGPWMVIDGDPFAQQPIVGLDGLPTVPDLLPSAVTAHIVAERSDGAATVVVIDDAALFGADPAARAAWLATWGLSASSGPTDFIEVATTSTSDGAVTLAAVNERSLGGRATFELIDAETADS